MLDIDPGDLAQVALGRGSKIEDVFTEKTIAPWIFVTVVPLLLCYNQGKPVDNFQGG